MCMASRRVDPAADRHHSKRERQAMTKIERQKAARIKLLRMLPRAQLERLSYLERPHMAPVPDLIARALDRWDGDAVRESFEWLFRRANDPIT